jgi:hypothetical protein
MAIQKAPSLEKPLPEEAGASVAAQALAEKLSCTMENRTSAVRSKDTKSIELSSSNAQLVTNSSPKLGPFGDPSAVLTRKSKTGKGF